MCGLSGFIVCDNSTISLDELQIMNRTMINRGPDAEGYYYMNGKLGLASRRLKIKDLSDGANMPLSNEDNSVQVVFNGAIYNFNELRQILIRDGHHFKTSGDTEVIVHSYEKWGIDCFSKFNGMFAIAIWDSKLEKIILARDRVGIKPLYYYYNNGNMAFASELKPLLKFPLFRKEINVESVYTYISLHNIPAPKTIFTNTFKLEPGTILEYHKGAFKISSYWDLLNVNIQNKQLKSTHEYLDEIDNLLTESVRQMLIADVPVGTFLSGGIDSSLIVSIMSKISPTKVNSFTIGFDDKKVNEAAHAKSIAEHLGLNHHTLYLEQKDISDTISTVAEHYDEPFGDLSLLPTLLLAKFAKKDITVALSGDGADEFFAGYPRFIKIGKMYSKEKWLSLNSISLLSKMSARFLTGKYKKMAQVFESKVLEKSYTYMMGHISEFDLRKISIDKLLGYASEVSKYKQNKMDSLDYTYYLLSKLYLPETVLNKTDRATMASSLEARVPFLDHRLIEYAGTIPVNEKIKNGQNKFLLRQLLNRYIPKYLTDRPKKGFDVPMDWNQKDLKELALHYFSKEKIDKEGYFDSKEIKKLLDEHWSGKMNHGHRLWVLLSFELWNEKYN
ncbi:MAG: asparagine synthase (glutamine-hydrolyzing) [Sphingobacteriaceae bacterium]|nr:asparagine synthase (glutamine-hydrolyzing) [Sphingobacteriaceae bacterium]